jgi:hypothetical protein
MKPCRVNNCPKYATDHGYCGDHQNKHRPPDPQQQRKRELAWNRPGHHLYNTSRWQRLRASVLIQEPLCRLCVADGVVCLATEVDHIEPHRGEEVKFWSGPFQPLCRSHHNQKSATERQERINHSNSESDK